MRGMLYLLIGFAVALAIGIGMTKMFGASPTADMVVPGTLPPEAEGFDWPLFCALAALAWGTAFIVRPRWLCIAVSLLVVALGSVFIAAGALGTLLDAGFNPYRESYGPIVVGFGAAILASRLLTLVLWWRASTVKRAI